MNKEKKEYVLYKGEKFTVEWYYTDKNKSQPFEYFNSLDSQQQMKLLYLVKRMGDFGKISDKRNLTLKRMVFGHLSLNLIGFFHFLQVERK